MKKIFYILIALPLHLFSQNFSEVSASIGVSGNFGDPNLGGGLSFCDFDGDGDDDLTFGSKAGESIYFFENNGGTFTELTTPLVPHVGISKQILWADFDNDGDKDFYVCDFESHDYLYRNDGGGSFTDITVSAGLHMDSTQTYGAAFHDYDKDGYLDLYVTNRGFNQIDAYMYRNNGDGTFSDVTLTSGTNLYSGGAYYDPLFNPFFFDYNNDGWPDVYVAVDRTGYTNRLLKNNGDGTFSDVSVASNSNVAINAMNAGGADYDNDGDIDLYVTNTPEGNAFLQNNGDGTFTDVALTNGTIFYRVGWGANFFDYDNDLDQDLYVSSMHNDATKPNAFYVNDGNGQFSEPLPNGLPGDTIPSIVNMIGDFNDDGKLDIVNSNHNTFPFQVYQNNETNSNNYLKVSLQGAISNLDGIGSLVEMWINGNKYIRYKHCGQAMMGQASSKLHFGMGTATQADSVIIKWPSGNVNKFYNVAANATLPVLETVALPVNLIDFSARLNEKENVDILWQVSQEFELLGYELQRSISGLLYETVDFYSATGATTKALYSHQDKSLLKGRRYYYRLKMVDLNGSFNYSKVVTVEVPSSDVNIDRLYPNPASDIITVDYSIEDNSQALIKVINVDGAIVYTQRHNFQKGGDQFQIDVSNFPAGNYWIKIDGRFETEEMQFIVVPKR